MSTTFNPSVIQTTQLTISNVLTTDSFTIGAPIDPSWQLSLSVGGGSLGATSYSGTPFVPAKANPNPPPPSLPPSGGWIVSGNSQPSITIAQAQATGAVLQAFYLPAGANVAASVSGVVYGPVGSGNGATVNFQYVDSKGTIFTLTVTISNSASFSPFNYDPWNLPYPQNLIITNCLGSDWFQVQAPPQNATGWTLNLSLLGPGSLQNDLFIATPYTPPGPNPTPPPATTAASGGWSGGNGQYLKITSEQSTQGQLNAVFKNSNNQQSVAAISLVTGTGTQRAVKFTASIEPYPSVVILIECGSGGG